MNNVLKNWSDDQLKNKIRQLENSNNDEIQEFLWEICQELAERNK